MPIRLLALSGIVGGLLWIGLAFLPPEWAPPGTADYAQYELWNRLWTPALLGMGLGFNGLFQALRSSLSPLAKRSFVVLLIAFALMMMGNIAEFWIFTGVPYSSGQGSNIRDVAWMAFLSGAVLTLIALTVNGLSLVRTALIPTGLGWLLILALPLTILISGLNMSWAGIPLGSLSVVVGILGLVMTRPASMRRSSETNSPRTLFVLWGVPWQLTPKSWRFIPTRIVFCTVLAFVFLPAESVGNRFLFGVIYGLLLVLAQCLHIVGHTLGGKSVGAPMTANLILDTRIFTYYSDDSADLPSRVHLHRALGGPLANIVVGLIALLVWTSIGGHSLLFFAAINAALGLGVLVPLPGIDGEVLWRELRRRKTTHIET